MRSALLLLLPLLSSCASIKNETRLEALLCLLLCVHVEANVSAEAENKKPAEAGLKTKSTQDFSDPEKDETPQSNADKYQPVKPQR